MVAKEAGREGAAVEPSSWREARGKGSRGKGKRHRFCVVFFFGGGNKPESKRLTDRTRGEEGHRDRVDVRERERE